MGKVVANNKMKIVKSKSKKKSEKPSSGHNSPKQNGGSESKLSKKMKTPSKAAQAYLKRVGGKTMGGKC